MENQHRKITGYRELDESEIDAMNAIKAMGGPISEMVEFFEKSELADDRWVEIGKTHLQQGLMALNRAVAKPDSF